MERALRIDIGNEIYHVLNRANARLTIFKKDNDYQAFETLFLSHLRAEEQIGKINRDIFEKIRQYE